MYMYMHVHVASNYVHILVCYVQVSSEAALDQDQGAVPYASQQQGKASSQTPSSDHSHLEVTFWQEVTDPNTNHVYYWNQESNQVSWTLPPNGVIANDVDSGTGTGQDGMGTEQDGTGIGKGGMGTGNSDGTNNKTVSTAGVTTSSLGKKATKKAAKKMEVDMFEGEPETKAAVGPAKDPSAEQPSDAVTKATVAIDNGGDGVGEKSSSKKRKASPLPAEVIGHAHEQTAKKQRVSAPGDEQKVGGAGESDATTPPVSKQAEQMIRVSVYYKCITLMVTWGGANGFDVGTGSTRYSVCIPNNYRYAFN